MSSDLACSWAVSDEAKDIRSEVAVTRENGFAGSGHRRPLHDPAFDPRRADRCGAPVGGTPTADPDGPCLRGAIPA